MWKYFTRSRGWGIRPSYEYTFQGEMVATIISDPKVGYRVGVDIATAKRKVCVTAEYPTLKSAKGFVETIVTRAFEGTSFEGVL